MFFSTLVFACGSSYGVLFFARSLQVYKYEYDISIRLQEKKTFIIRCIF